VICEGGVVSAAVLCVKHKRHIEYAGFKIGILAVYAKNMEKIFSRRKSRSGRMDKQTLSVVVVRIRLIAVNRQHRKKRYQLKALTEHVFNRRIVGIFVIGIKREHASCEAVHHIAARRFQDYIADKARRKGAQTFDMRRKIIKLFLIRKHTEKEKVNAFLVSEATVSGKAADEIIHIIAAVIKLALTGDGDAVLLLRRLHLGYFGKSGEDTFSV